LRYYVFGLPTKKITKYFKGFFNGSHEDGSLEEKTLAPIHTSCLGWGLGGGDGKFIPKSIERLGGHCVP
jgi:hypothetical protein